MKVLHLYKTYLPEDFTGVPRVIHALAEGMVEQGVETRVLTLGPSSDATTKVDRHSVHIARRDMDIASTGFSIEAISTYKELSAQADIVHYHFPWPFADILHFSVRPSCPTIVTYHSDIVRQRLLLPLYAPLRDRFLRDVDLIVATSRNYVSSSAVLRRFADKTSVIPIGIPDIVPAEAGLVARWRKRVEQDFFLFVGTLRYYKGLEYLMRAARDSGARVVIAGAGNSVEWAQLGGPTVTFVGSISDADKVALLELCRAFVFPSHLRSEAFGIALLEAARAGRALISCEIGTGTSFINRDRVTGFVIPPADSKALAEAMQILANEPDTALRMGQKARQRYQMFFRAGTMAKAYFETYQRLIQLNRRPVMA
jgi:rhamnosyl/mannosyltransferase